MTSNIKYNGFDVVRMGINHLRETITLLETYQQMPKGISPEKARVLPFLKIVLEVQEFCEKEFARTNKKAVVPIELEEAFKKAEKEYYERI